MRNGFPSILAGIDTIVDPLDPPFALTNVGEPSKDTVSQMLLTTQTAQSTQSTQTTQRTMLMVLVGWLIGQETNNKEKQGQGDMMPYFSRPGTQIITFRPAPVFIYLWTISVRFKQRLSCTYVIAFDMPAAYR